MRDRRHTTLKAFLRPALWSLVSLGALALSPLPGTWQLAHAAKKESPPIRRFTFKIDPKTELKDLLPVPPRLLPGTAPLLSDLTQVPEVHFQEPLNVTRLPANLDKLSEKEKIEARLKRDAEADKLLEATAHQIAKMNFLNQKRTDHFMELLLAQRPDLAGLSFVMGADCRLSKERGEWFASAVERFRSMVLERRLSQLPRKTETFTAKEAWRRWEEKYPPLDAARPERKEQHHAVLAALTQMLPAEATDLRAGVVSYLAARSDKDATLALARLALFDADDAVRKAALVALEKRPPADVKDTLLAGLSYPWPEIAENAATAITHLKRTDLLSNLVDLLDQPDPRTPTLRAIKGKKVPVVRELVRLNHHRNCLLCHPPGNTPGAPDDALVAAVPIPGESLSPGRYGFSSPDVVVRADVTYLRQDFSRMQKVVNHGNWPELQRFDFLVRTRTLSDAEAKTYQAVFARLEKRSPYRQAVLGALRSLTGRDPEPTAQAWRKVLETPAPTAVP
ncbi:MAG TPA: HEAT repeat domain-containing protein [Gemmataceae bacterium]|nr:HEAT repeat domain-containing protein [Gemmataceae bacterium]